jgi:hypothetical protein
MHGLGEHQCERTRHRYRSRRPNPLRPTWNRRAHAEAGEARRRSTGLLSSARGPFPRGSILIGDVVMVARYGAGRGRGGPAVDDADRQSGRISPKSGRLRESAERQICTRLLAQ